MCGYVFSHTCVFNAPPMVDTPVEKHFIYSDTQGGSKEVTM